MKQYFNVTLAIEVETGGGIKCLEDIDANINDLNIEAKDAKIKVIDVPECYEISM